MQIVTKQVLRVSKVLANMTPEEGNVFLNGVMLGLEISKEVDQELRKEVKNQLTYIEKV